MDCGDTFLMPAPGVGATPHLWIIISQPDPRTYHCAIVSVTTLRNSKDQTVILRVGDHPFIRHDNVYKMIVSIMAVAIAADRALGARYLALAGAVFVIPFLAFAGHAGQVADRFSKTRVLQVTKSFEIAIMLLGIVALVSHRIEPILLVLFLLAVQANFFSPAKYGILPEMVSEAQLSRANGLLELSTFVAIVIGTSFGTFLYEHWKDQPVRMGAVLTGIAIAGMLASLRIPKTRAAGAPGVFHWNPFTEVLAGAWTIRASRSLWLTVIGISWFWFVGGLFQMSLLLLGSEVLHVSEVHVGLLMTALAAGIGLGSLAAGSLSGDHIELGLVPVGCGLMGVFAIALGATTSYPFALLWLAAIGFSGGLFAVPLNAFLQDVAGAAEKGRILATNNFVNMVGVILASGIRCRTGTGVNPDGTSRLRKSPNQLTSPGRSAFATRSATRSERRWWEAAC